MSWVRLIIAVGLIAVVSVAAAGCRKQVPLQFTAPPSSASTSSGTAPSPPPPPGPPPGTRGVSGPGGPGGAGGAGRLSEEEAFARKSLDQLNAEHPLNDVFFDLDKAEIRNDAREWLQRDVEWLKKFASTRVTVEGHCDARGSAEYNLALGSRRADAVKNYMVSLGLAANRITVVSKGKEQPFCNQEIESCWQENRRGHFLLTAK